MNSPEWFRGGSRGAEIHQSRRAGVAEAGFASLSLAHRRAGGAGAERSPGQWQRHLQSGQAVSEAECPQARGRARVSVGLGVVAGEQGRQLGSAEPTGDREHNVSEARSCKWRRCEPGVPFSRGTKQESAILFVPRNGDYCLARGGVC